MVLSVSLLVSCIPSILLYIYLRNLRIEDPGFRSNCRRLLVKGIFCSVGVALLALTINIVWSISGFAKDSPLLKEAFKAFVMAAFVEELVKYLTANKVIRKNCETVSRLDCMAFCAIVGIGFQVIETVVYLLESNVIQILVRGFTMGHPAYGMLMGRIIGESLYEGKRSCSFKAVAVPLVLHGMYDFSLAEEFQAINDNLVFVPFILIFIELFILIRSLVLIKRERKGETYTKPLSGI
jgi:RsiW-degrading membrane proteinase PrsW (M82 family)